MSKILLITDAAAPQINGVVKTLGMIKLELEKLGDEVKFITPNDFKGFRWPFYKDIKICFASFNKIENIINDFDPDHIHIATEGPLGLLFRLYCDGNNLPFTTSYHTKFPEYLKDMYHVPKSLSYKYFKWFHSKANRVLVPTESVKLLLESKDFSNVYVWERGVDISSFYPMRKLNDTIYNLLYVGRVSIEKNIEAFLNLDIPNSRKIVVGDGPIRKKLQNKYKNVLFVGSKTGSDLTNFYSQADVFVFPSKTDTYGLVLLESLACGTPFVSFPEPGPLEIAKLDYFECCCFMGYNLKDLIYQAIEKGNRSECVKLASNFSWSECAKKFKNYLICVAD